jgi:hypothetical protein
MKAKEEQDALYPAAKKAEGRILLSALRTDAVNICQFHFMQTLHPQTNHPVPLPERKPS